MCLYSSIMLPLVVFSDHDFFPGWEKEFENVANMFLTINFLSSALVQSIEQTDISF